MKNVRIARIFRELTGKYHVCDSDLNYLNARGCAYGSRREAIASLRGALQDYPPEALYPLLQPRGMRNKT